MFSINEEANSNGIIGSDNDCDFIEYASIKKYITELGDESLKLSMIKFYYKINSYLVAINYIFQSKENFGKKDPSTFLYGRKELIGAIKTYDPITNPDIEEITLNLSIGEEICSVLTCYKKGVFLRLTLNTTKGQFINVGSRVLEYNFSFNYFYNGSFFDGFVIGATDQAIAYIISLIYNDKEKEAQAIEIQENQLALKLVDKSEDFLLNINTMPIYKTKILGTINKNTLIVDDIDRTGFLDEIKEGKIVLSQINIYSNSKKITKFENFYTDYKINKVYIVLHQSNSFKEENKRYSLIMSKDDYINNAIVYISKTHHFVQKISLTTFKGRTLECDTPKSDNIYEVKKEQPSENIKILGMCIGCEKFIHFIQFYYENCLPN